MCGLFVCHADEFNRWEAGQRLAKKLLVKLYENAIDSSKVLAWAFTASRLSVGMSCDCATPAGCGRIQPVFGCACTSCV